MNKPAVFVGLAFVASVILVDRYEWINRISGNGMVSGFLFILIATFILPFWDKRQHSLQNNKRLIAEIDGAAFRLESCLVKLVGQAKHFYVGPEGAKQPMSFNEIECIRSLLTDTDNYPHKKEILRRSSLSIECMNECLEKNIQHIQQLLDRGLSGKNVHHNDLSLKYACKNSCHALYHLNKLKEFLQSKVVHDAAQISHDEMERLVTERVFSEEVDEANKVSEWLSSDKPFMLIARQFKVNN
ncbi:hypothetical protein ACK31C_18850 [Aeromonas caviae]